MRKLSLKSIQLLNQYEALWREVSESLYDDLCDPSLVGLTSFDIEAIELIGKLAPRPLIFPSTKES